MENNSDDKKNKTIEKGLTLTRVSEGLQVGIKSDGKKYSVRDDRSKYFFPEDWIKFFDKIKPEKQEIFDTAINTGGRIDELLHIKPKDFDWDKNTLTLRVTKRKASKKERVGKPRTFKISSQYARRIRKYINENKLGDEDILFPMSKQAVYQMFRRTLKKIRVQDWFQFSLHNIRKTHGNYLKALGVDSGEICYRLGHDLNTFIKHYGSANIFDRKDKVLMIKILGDVYDFDVHSIHIR
jgi:integrase